MSATLRPQLIPLPGNTACGTVSCTEIGEQVNIELNLTDYLVRINIELNLTDYLVWIDISQTMQCSLTTVQISHLQAIFVHHACKPYSHFTDHLRAEATYK